MDQRPIGMFDRESAGLPSCTSAWSPIPMKILFIWAIPGVFLWAEADRGDQELRLADRLLTFLSLDVKLLVVACNSATASALPWLQEQLEASIGAVHPEAEAAVQTTHNRLVGILATEATVASGSYARALLNLDAGLKFFPRPVRSWPR